MKKLILCLVSAAALVVSQARAQVIANTFTNLETLPASIGTGATSNLVSQPIYINPGYGVSLQFAVQSGGNNTTTTSNVTVKVNVSMDGTNWLTTAPYSCSATLNGTNIITGGTNFPSWFFDGFAKARVESMGSANSTNIIPVSVMLGRAKQTFTHP